jgi:acetate CoA/acetoacetate CoA-transferase beta subunit
LISRAQWCAVPHASIPTRQDGRARKKSSTSHAQKDAPKIVDELTLPATSLRPVTLVVTELAVIEPTPEGLMLRERAPSVAVDAIRAATAATLLVPAEVPEMVL